MKDKQSEKVKLLLKINLLLNELQEPKIYVSRLTEIQRATESLAKQMDEHLETDTIIQDHCNYIFSTIKKESRQQIRRNLEYLNTILGGN